MSSEQGVDNPALEDTENAESKVDTNNGVTHNALQFAEKTELPGDGSVASEEELQPNFKGFKISKQILLVIIWLCMGLAGEMPSPTLVDLRQRLGVNYEEISQALLAKGIGSIFGALLGGFINERFYHHLDLSMAISLLLIAAAAVVIPYSTTLALTGAMFAVNGLAEGLINTGGNTMVMHLWGEDAASPMNSLHFGFGLGALIAPQIARPFLSPDALDVDDEVTTMSTTTLFNNITKAPEIDESQIEIPYIIAASAVTLFALFMVGFYIRGPPKGFQLRQAKSNFREMINPGSCANGRVCFGVQLLVALFLYYIQTVGGERAYGKFLFSFAVDSDIKMKKSEATNLQTVFWASFTAGRLSGVLIGKFVPLRYVMIGNVLGNVITASILAAYAEQNSTVLWVFSCIMGAFISIAFPNGMSWANLHLNMNSMGVMILVIGGGCGDFAYNYLTGFLFDKDPQNLMYVMVGYAVLLLAVFVLMELLACLNDRNFVENRVEDVWKDVEINETDGVKIKSVTDLRSV